MKHAKKVLIALLVITLISGCTSKKNKYTDKVESVFDVYDTPLQPLNTIIKITLRNESKLKKIMPLVNERIKNIHELADGYHHFSGVNNINTINQCTSEQFPLQIDPSLFKLIQHSIDITKLSKGYFNPTVEPLYRLWQDKFSPYPIENTEPSEQAIKEALSCVVNYQEIDDYIILDNNTITIKPMENCTQGIKLNLGAISKGYAADVLLPIMEDDYLIDIGTSSIATQGQWRVGFRSVYDPTKSLFTINTKDKMILSNSGDNTQFFLLDDGTIRCHNMNPYTGKSENYYRNVSVLTNGPSWLADALTTTIFSIENIEEVNEMIKTLEKTYDCEIHYCLVKETSKEDKTLTLITDKYFHSLLTDIDLHITNIEYGR